MCNFEMITYRRHNMLMSQNFQKMFVKNGKQVTPLWNAPEKVELSYLQKKKTKFTLIIFEIH